MPASSASTSSRVSSPPAPSVTSASVAASARSAAAGSATRAASDRYGPDSVPEPARGEPQPSAFTTVSGQVAAAAWASAAAPAATSASTAAHSSSVSAAAVPGPSSGRAIWPAGVSRATSSATGTICSPAAAGGPAEVASPVPVLQVRPIPAAVAVSDTGGSPRVSAPPPALVNRSAPLAPGRNAARPACGPDSPSSAICTWAVSAAARPLPARSPVPAVPARPTASTPPS